MRQLPAGCFPIIIIRDLLAAGVFLLPPAPVLMRLHEHLRNGRRPGHFCRTYFDFVAGKEEQDAKYP